MLCKRPERHDARRLEQSLSSRPASEALALRPRSDGLKLSQSRLANVNSAPIEAGERAVNPDFGPVTIVRGASAAGSRADRAAWPAGKVGVVADSDPRQRMRVVDAKSLQQAVPPSTTQPVQSAASQAISRAAQTPTGTALSANEPAEVSAPQIAPEAERNALSGASPGAASDVAPDIATGATPASTATASQPASQLLPPDRRPVIDLSDAEREDQYRKLSQTVGRKALDKALKGRATSSAQVEMVTRLQALQRKR